MRIRISIEKLGRDVARTPQGGFDTRSSIRRKRKDTVVDSEAHLTCVNVEELASMGSDLSDVRLRCQQLTRR